MPSPEDLLRPLLEAALGYPEAWEDHPWDETVVKVRKKVFVFLGVHHDGRAGCTVKLPESAEEALQFPFAEPAGYGLGRSGWVNCAFAPSDEPPLDLLLDWLDESYRTVAPKTLVKQLPELPAS